MIFSPPDSPMISPETAGPWLRSSLFWRKFCFLFSNLVGNDIISVDDGVLYEYSYYMCQYVIIWYH